MRRPIEEYYASGKDHWGYIEPQVTSDSIEPPYISEEISETVKTVQSLQDDHTVTFGFLTDTHYAVDLNLSYQIRLRRTLNAWRRIAAQTAPQMLILGGDHCNDGKKEYKAACFRALREELAGIPYFPVNGNHDDSSIWDVSFIPSDVSVNHLEPLERYVLFYNHLPQLGCRFDEDRTGLYYFYDYVPEKVRFIFLNTDDVPYVKDNGLLRYRAQWYYGASQAQLDWLAHRALRFDEPGWTVVLAAHISPVTIVGKGEDLSRISAIHEILKAYKNGEKLSVHEGEGDFVHAIEADYAADGNRAEIAGAFFGHEHTDAFQIVDGIPYVITANSVMYGEGGRYLPRKDGDKTELLFDVITLNKRSRTVTAVRVGSGEDRNYRY